MSKQNPISGQDEKISKLSSDVEKISRSLNEIIEANDSNGNRKNDVHDLLTNVIEFCNSTETMDKESLTSLVEILEKTDDAFNELDKNIKNTSDNTSTINQYISDIRQLVTEMNSVLNEDDVLEES